MAVLSRGWLVGHKVLSMQFIVTMHDHVGFSYEAMKTVKKYLMGQFSENIKLPYTILLRFAPKLP